jgi:cobalamin biosynthesis protein CobD/CbiB
MHQQFAERCLVERVDVEGADLAAVLRQRLGGGAPLRRDEVADCLAAEAGLVRALGKLRVDAGATAGALGLRLNGPRVYGITPVDDRWMGEGRAEATADDVDRALRLARVALALQFAGYAALLILTLVG